MMARRKRLIIIVIASVILFIVGFVLKDVFLLTIFYKSNNSFGNEANGEIKSLILNSIKDRHSIVFSYDKNELYTKDRASYEILSQNNQNEFQTSFLFIDIDDDFMESLKRTKINIQLNWI